MTKQKRCYDTTVDFGKLENGESFRFNGEKYTKTSDKAALKEGGGGLRLGAGAYVENAYAAKVKNG